MFTGSIKRRVGQWLAVAALLGCGFAMAQSEPTLKQVYAEAQAGRLEQAQVMMQQVLVAHPGSAKAHFVQAELAARQGKVSHAREALATAEKLAPGLPFAKPEAVQALRSQLAARNSAPVNGGSSSHAQGAAAPAAYAAPAASLSSAAPASAFPWGLALALGGGAIAIAIFMSRKKSMPAAMPPGNYANPGAGQGGLSGQQGFGMGNNMGSGAMAPGYGQASGTGQPAGMGLGGKVMGGLATGLAVGAGVMAAQAIGKSLMGNDQHPHQPDNLANNNGFEPLAGNSDLGGQNFGVNDTGSWDDGDALASSGDGGDWDV
jgi:hypothetical protein